jgi:hypothetical protein
MPISLEFPYMNCLHALQGINYMEFTIPWLYAFQCSTFLQMIFLWKTSGLAGLDKTI